jgi:hypothetical protein
VKRDARRYLLNLESTGGHEWWTGAQGEPF